MTVMTDAVSESRDRARTEVGLNTEPAPDRARRLHDRPGSLPELSQALAGATTVATVAHLLAQGTPGVIDCDRASIFLWDPERELLRCAAVTGLDEKLVRGMTLSAAEKRDLLDAGAGARTAPRFFDRDSEDSPVRAIMDRLGSAAIVVAPIAGKDRLHGVLKLAVTDRPQRLSRTKALEDSLASIVAEACTGLERARAIEQIAYEARHDHLTGLPDRRALQEAIDARTRAPSAAPLFALASVAIDDFEQINEEHGHPAADEALCRVASVLIHTVRRDDAVFRVGDEEFAVLLPGLRSGSAHPVVERVRRAVAAESFRCSLRVSVGVASWPHDATEPDRLLERTDSALSLARRTGKNRTGLAA